MSGNTDTLIASTRSPLVASDEMHFTKGQGDIGPFILHQALTRGARAMATNSLPSVGGEWGYCEDQHGVVLQLPRDRFAEVQRLLRHIFGPPAHEPSETLSGDRMGWYAVKDIGVGLQFAHDRERTQVIVLRPQPLSEILKRTPAELQTFLISSRLRRLSERRLGFLEVVISAMLTYTSIISPLLAASRHAESVTLFRKGAVLAPTLLVIGIMNVAMGERATRILGASRILGRRRKPSALGWVIYLVTFGLGFLMYHWIENRLRE